MNLVRLALAALLVALLAVGGTWVVWTVDESVRRDRARAAEADPTPAAQRVADPVRVLRAWDRRRARAWARGDLQALTRLYVPGSEAGRVDVAMLRSYARRGLVVEGLGSQVVEVEVVRRGDEVLVLTVTDRVSGGTVVGRGVRRELPTDEVSRREVELRLRDGDWLVAEVVERSVGAQAG